VIKSSYHESIVISCFIQILRFRLITKASLMRAIENDILKEKKGDISKKGRSRCVALDSRALHNHTSLRLTFHTRWATATVSNKRSLITTTVFASFDSSFVEGGVKSEDAVNSPLAFFLNYTGFNEWADHSLACPPLPFSFLTSMFTDVKIARSLAFKVLSKASSPTVSAKVAKAVAWILSYRVEK
jgi:hypothetical protein